MANLHQPWVYKLYGMLLAADRPLPGLRPIQTDALADVYLQLEGQQQRPSSNPGVLSSGLDILPKSDGDYYRVWFRGDGELSFVINPEGTQITAHWEKSVIEEVTTLLIGQVMGCALRLQGWLCLHACVIRVGTQAIALVGESGAGKSTLAAFFAQRDHAILADDIAALQPMDAGYQVQPGYPRLRLWPQSMRALYGGNDDLEAIFSFSEKRYLALSAEGDTQSALGTFHDQPLPLAAIYLLHKRQPELILPSLQALPSPAALMALLQHRSVSHLPLDKLRQQVELQQFSKIIQTIPVKQLHRSDNLQDLPAVYEAVLTDFARLTSS
jgi:hypothetical protein